jgi:pimeloyl-ACP methyl ester carboxylesterase
VDAAQITLDAMVDDLFAVMDARGVDRCVLAGESRGAQVALLAAARHPERFEGLVLVAPSVSTGGPPIAFIAALREDYPGAIRAFVDRCLPEADSDHLRKWGRDILGRAEPESAVSLLECAYEPPDYGRITMPVAVIHGTIDAIASIETAQRLADDLPDATFHALEGAGHVPTLSVPQCVASIIGERFDTGVS